MAWTGVITNAGANLLDQWALGGTLTITSAATGTGTVDTAALVNQTNLKSRKQTASIISKVRKSSGVKVKLQITAPSTGYTLNQYGVWAKLGSGAAVLLALFQREDGVPIPSSSETPEFVYTLYALLTISNTGTLEVTVDTSALVSQSTLEEAMDTKVDKVSGKGLSTNDYTTAEKNKLAGIEAQANKYTHPAYTARTGKPTANLTPGFGDTVTVSQITSDASGHVTGATDRTIKIPATAASTSAAGLMSAADKTKLNGIATGAEVNQNAFSNVKVGSTTIAADAKTDTLEIVAGDNITLTPDATNDKVTIKATDTTYTSKAAASGGTALSLVTTGEKYTWNSKANGSHTHTSDAVTDLVTATKYGPSGLVSFNGKEGLPLKSCIVGIEPAQSGSGDPSPSNVRAISGWTGLHLHVSPTEDVADGKTYTVDWTDEAGTVYGGTLDVLKGTLTIDKKVVVIKGDDSETWSSVNQSYSIALIRTSGIVAGNLMASHYTSVSNPVKWSDLGNNQAQCSSDNYIGYKDIANNGTSVATAKAYAQQQYSNGTPITFVGKLKSPVIYQLTPSQVASLAGQNRVWADAGDVTVEYGAFLQALEGAVENHVHDAEDIAFGILPVERGGTGNSTGYVTAGQKSGTTLGTNATAEGYNVTASGNYSHAEGYGSVSDGIGSHAEGQGKAYGGSSHAEGGGKAYGVYSHAEGNGSETEENASYSHVEGYQTIASCPYQHVVGVSNVKDTHSPLILDSDSLIEIVGGGSPGSSGTRKNIRTLKYNGNEWIAGTLTQASDARLKDVQGEVPDLSSVRAVRFKWNNTNGEHDDKDHIGYIAQEVEKIAPYLVGDDSNGYKSLDYIALLVAKVEMLERRVAELEGR